MTTHHHFYSNCGGWGGWGVTGSIVDFDTYSALCGVTYKNCPSGHSFCQANALGTLYDDLVGGVFEEGTFFQTSEAENTLWHTHTYNRIEWPPASIRNKIGIGVQFNNSCDVSPIYGGVFWESGIPISAEFVERETGVGGPGVHSHTMNGCGILLSSLEVRPVPLVTGFSACSLGHPNCKMTILDIDLIILGTYGYSTGGDTSTIEASVVETLPAGWTATLLTLTPPLYIDRTWALVRGNLQTLETDYTGIYLGFDFWKMENQKKQQWYNPPGGATKVKNPLLFSVNLGGLMPGTTYNYQAKAQLDSNINSALLRGQVTLEVEGLPTTLSFEWGETTEYGHTVFVKTASYSCTFSKVVAYYLDPEVTYHYRAMAVNALGTTYGEDMEFTVLGVIYGEQQSFQTESLPPPIPPVLGLGNDYRSAKQAIENVAGLSLARSYGDDEGNFQYESRKRRQA